MSPSELKKLRNKQKKAKRKAEAEKANAQNKIDDAAPQVSVAT